MENNFAIKARVYYEDTDAGGIVYHANYLRFTERARTEWLRGAGKSQHELLAEGTGYVIVKMKARFRKSAHLDDELRITCIPVKVRRVGIYFYQEVLSASGELLFEMDCEVACLNLRTGLPQALPAEAMAYARSHIPANAAELGVK